MEDVRTLARHHRSQADHQGASREAPQVVLKENPPPLVENQQFKKTREDNYPCFFAPKSFAEFFLLWNNFQPDRYAREKSSVAHKWCKEEDRKSTRLNSSHVAIS